MTHGAAMSLKPCPWKVIIATGYFDGFVKNGVNGFIIGEWDVNHVADIIIDTWSNRGRYARICRNAIIFAKKNLLQRLLQNLLPHLQT